MNHCDIANFPLFSINPTHQFIITIGEPSFGPQTGSKKIET